MKKRRFWSFCQSKKILNYSKCRDSDFLFSTQNFPSLLWSEPTTRPMKICMLPDEATTTFFQKIKKRLLYILSFKKYSRLSKTLEHVFYYFVQRYYPESFSAIQRLELWKLVRPSMKCTRRFCKQYHKSVFVDVVPRKICPIIQHAGTGCRQSFRLI